MWTGVGCIAGGGGDAGVTWPGYVGGGAGAAYAGAGALPEYAGGCERSGRAGGLAIGRAGATGGAGGTTGVGGQVGGASGMLARATAAGAGSAAGGAADSGACIDTKYGWDTMTCSLRRIFVFIHSAAFLRPRLATVGVVCAVFHFEVKDWAQLRAFMAFADRTRGYIPAHLAWT